MRVDSRVHVGSVAKGLLAAGVLGLIAEGKLSLDTPVAPLLPTLSFNNRWSDTDRVRVRHLLAHTAGIENFRLWHLFSTHARADTPPAAPSRHHASQSGLDRHCVQLHAGKLGWQRAARGAVPGRAENADADRRPPVHVGRALG
jgi:CubicO group peptidase (beta-lactamase class C family)